MYFRRNANIILNCLKIYFTLNRLNFNSLSMYNAEITFILHRGNITYLYTEFKVTSNC